MGTLFIMMGKSASGKDTIYQKVREEFQGQLHEIVMYTTRPIREGEQEGKEYHFVTNEQYEQLEAKGTIIEERAYDTIYGIWRYFTVEDGQIQLEDKNYIMLGTLESYQKLRTHYGKKAVQPVYIEVDTGERLERALTRERKQTEPKYAELCRRFLADEADFSEEKLAQVGIKKRYINDELTQCTAEISADIRKML